MARLFLAVVALFLVDAYARDFRSDSQVSWDDKSKFQTTVGIAQTPWGELRYEIHAHPRDESYVQRVERILKSEAGTVIDYFQYVPKERLHFVVNGDDTLPNGSATVFPRNLIILNTYPPVKHDYLSAEDGYIRGLVLHELVHILHMDQTRGVLEVARTIFGSVGKLGGVVPRWFAEGVATWAESEFTNGGRLKSKRLDYALRHFLSQKNSCRTIDCLDEPGVYPGGSLAYWAGAKFLQSLENEKAGTIRCLVTSNADNLPFFLNKAFKSCSGKTADDGFKEFLSKFAPLEISEGFWPLGEKRVNFQKGLLLSGDELVFVTMERGAERINFVNLTSNQTRTLRLPLRVHQLRYLDKNGDVIVSVMSHRSHETVRQWIKINPENLEFEKINTQGEKSIDYLINDIEIIREKQHFEFWQNQEKKHELPELSEVKDAGLSNDELWWSEYDANNELPYALKQLNKTLWRYHNPFTVLTSCRENFLIQINNGLVLVEKSKAYKLSNPNSMVELHGNNKWQVIIKEDDLSSPEIIPGNCDVIFDQLKKDGAVELIKRTVSTPKPSVVESFPSLHHFKPHYWLLGYKGGDNVSSWIASTTISDPLDRHVFFLNAYWYPSLSKATPDISYTYDYNSWLFELSHSKHFTESGINLDVDKDRITTFSISREFDLGPWMILPGLFRSWRKSDDFISSRSTIDTGLRFAMIAPPLLGDQLIQLSELSGRFFHSKNRGLENYWGGQVRFASSFRLLAPTALHTHYTYGRLAKSGYQSGVLFAGGSNDVYSANFHEFYGLARNEAFGNTVQTARLQLDQEIGRIFRTSGLTPFYFKTLHLLAGADWLQTDRIFIDGKFLRDQDVFSYHAGAKLRADVAYLAPIDMELIYSRLKNPVGDDQDSWLFLVKGSIFP